jgi:hypothetical protein
MKKRIAPLVALAYQLELDYQPTTQLAARA